MWPSKNIWTLTVRKGIGENISEWCLISPMYTSYKIELYTLYCSTIDSLFLFLLFSSRTRHGLRTPKETFFSKILNFWDWADILGWNFLRHLGYFWPILVLWVPCPCFPLFNYYFYENISTSQTFIWDWDLNLNLNLGRKELGI